MIENSPHETLARRLADRYQQHPQVEAVAMAGSRTSGAEIDPAADIDLCVYITAPLPFDARQALIEQVGGASIANLNLDFWGLGDEWFDARTGIEVDAVYWETTWIESVLDRVLRMHQASLGYSTAFWHTVRSSQVLFDRQGWFARMQEWAGQPYPEELRREIMTRNFAVLRDIIPSYLHQIEKAVQRGDLVSVNHRVAGLMASYFDVLFAFNRVLHPGEKRLIDQAARLCPRLPENMATQVTDVLRSAGAGDQTLMENINRLVDGLEALLASE